MENVPKDERIWWLHDAVRLEAEVDTGPEEPDDLYAMPIEELKWAIENRIVFDDTLEPRDSV